MLEDVHRVLNLDEDLSAFYELVASDPDLAWAAGGAGRMLRLPTVFEAVVKTVCTTNCAWSGTVRMVSALVEQLGQPTHGAPHEGELTNAFPTPSAMAEVDEAFYWEVVRAGYRGAYLKALATSVADGSLDLEELGAAPSDELSDDEVASRLLALPGVGPYAAAHIMMLLGRHSLLILDSWTRPTYARLVGRKRVGDATIKRRFRRYGSFAGLAFWLLPDARLGSGPRGYEGGVRVREIGHAAISRGWRRRVAERAAEGISQRTRFSAEQVRWFLGVAFFARSLAYLIRAVRDAIRRRPR